MTQYRRILVGTVTAISVLPLSLSMLVKANASILTWAYGIHQPCVESECSILKAAKRYGDSPVHAITLYVARNHPSTIDYIGRRNGLLLQEHRDTVVFRTAGEHYNISY